VSGPGDDAERAAKVARAWTLHGRRWSSRMIGRELGVSHVTAQAWIEEARQAEEWREITERAGRRGRMSAVLNEVARIGVERLLAVEPDTLPDGSKNPRAGQPVERYKDVAPALLGYLQEINRVEGNYAPVRVSVEDDRRPPDPGLLAAMALERDRALAADEQEQRRALEDG
jgi:hypothetical protein